MKKKDKNRKVGRLYRAIVFNRKATHGGTVEVIIAIVCCIHVQHIYQCYITLRLSATGSLPLPLPTPSHPSKNFNPRI